MNKHYYITTPIYYINDVPHIGHAYTTIAADIMARYKRMCGYDVFFLTGTDEHGQKVEKAAAQQGYSPRGTGGPDGHAGLPTSGRSSTSRTRASSAPRRRGTGKSSISTVPRQLHAKGDIYLGEYEDWYCVPCESYFTELQLKDGQVP